MVQLVVADRVGRAHALGVGGLEGGDARALRDPAGGDGLGDGGAVGLGQRRARERDLHQEAFASGESASSRSTRHQLTRRVRPSSSPTSASKPRRSRAALRVGQAAGDAVDRPRRAVDDREVRVHDLQQRLGELEQARLHAAGDVEDLVGQVGVGGQDVGAGDVADVDEVHRLQAVAEDERRLAGLDALHPAHEHLGVEAVDVHPRAVGVEVAQRDVVEVRHRLEAAQQALVEDLGRAVERVVGVRVVVLGAWGTPRRARRSRPTRRPRACARPPARRPRRRCRCRRRGPRAPAAAPPRTA